ncbi:MAG: hypothetical protein AAGU27_17190 [Dehalobacterium sp.]
MENYYKKNLSALRLKRVYEIGATTFSLDDFNFLAAKFNITPNIIEIDESSLFCEIIAP